jgi:hypothetical protein
MLGNLKPLIHAVNLDDCASSDTKLDRVISRATYLKSLTQCARLHLTLCKVVPLYRTVPLPLRIPDWFERTFINSSFARPSQDVRSLSRDAKRLSLSRSVYHYAATLRAPFIAICVA